MDKIKKFSDFSHLRKDMYKDFSEGDKKMTEKEALNHIEDFIKNNEIDNYRKYRHGDVSNYIWEFLEKNEFDHIGGGQQANVFRKKNSPYVIKVLRSDGIMFCDFTNEFMDKDFENNFLKYTYISPTGWFAIQPHVDDSKDAREKAHKIIGHLMNIKSNLGMYNGDPVIIDAI